MPKNEFVVKQVTSIKASHLHAMFARSSQSIDKFRRNTSQANLRSTSPKGSLIKQWIITITKAYSKRVTWPMYSYKLDDQLDDQLELGKVGPHLAPRRLYAPFIRAAFVCRVKHA